MANGLARPIEAYRMRTTELKGNDATSADCWLAATV